MEIEWSELKTKLNDQSYRNFFKAFGFLIVRNLLKKQEVQQWRREYDALYLDHFKKSVHTITKERGQTLIPNFVDSSKFYAKAAFDERFMALARYICGDSFIYLGSDGSAFRRHSFNWHRDWHTNNPVVKFNIYLNPPFFLGGDFRIIPGTQFPSDTFSSLINHGSAWPSGQTVDGGLNERQYFPFSTPPRRHYLKKLWSKLTRRTFEIPSTRIKVKNGDLIIFDQRALHVVERTFPTVTRRLLTLLFAENPRHFPDTHYLFNPPPQLSIGELSKEIEELFWLERAMIDVPAYGQYLTKDHVLYPANLITSEPHTSPASRSAPPSELTQSSGAATEDNPQKNVWYTHELYRFSRRNLRDIRA